MSRFLNTLSKIEMLADGIIFSMMRLINCVKVEITHYNNASDIRIDCESQTDRALK